MGSFIRKTRIDELPQIYNVLNGTMSFVGPRPERPEIINELAKEIPYYHDRHRVKPGITGWAQVNGRNALDWESKFSLDVWYVDHLSWRLDWKILLLTVGKTLKRDGINQEGEATVEEFRGNGV